MTRQRTAQDHRLNNEARVLIRLVCTTLATALTVAGLAVTPALAETANPQIAPEPTSSIPDTAPPVLASSEVTPSGTSLADGPVTVTVRATITDETGTETPTINISNDATGQSHGFGEMNLISGATTDGTWERVVEIPTTAVPGNWDVILSPLTDTHGNSGTDFRTLTTIKLTGGTGDVKPTAPVSSDVVWSYTSLAGNGGRSDGENAGVEKLDETAPSSFPSVSVEIEGIAKVGSTLTAKIVREGAETTTISYQWHRDGVDISGAIESTYKLVGADAYSSVSVSVTSSVPGVEPTTVHSQPTTMVLAGDLTPGTPTITGVPRVGEILTADPGLWEPDGVNLTYSWSRGGTSVGTYGARVYRITEADVGERISVTVHADLQGFDGISVMSESVPIRELHAYGGGAVLSSEDRIPVHVKVQGLVDQSSPPGELTVLVDGRDASIECDGPWEIAWKRDEAARYCTIEQSGKLGNHTATISLEAFDGSGTYESEFEVWTFAPLEACFSGGQFDAANQVWVDPDELCWQFSEELRGSIPDVSFDYQIYIQPSFDEWSPDEPDPGFFLNGPANLENGRFRLSVDEHLIPIPAGQYTVTAQLFGGGAEVAFWGNGDDEGLEAIAWPILWTESRGTVPVPSIRGQLRVGEVVSANPGNWPTGTKFAYRWLRDGALVTTGSSYQVKPTDLGTKFTVEVTGTVPGYPAMKSGSQPTTVAAGSMQSSTPTITGTFKVGSTLTAKPGAWASGTTFKYQWYRNGTAISGATSSTYKLVAADAGMQITVKVTGSKSGYNNASKTSSKTAKIAKATLTTATPAITGTVKVGSTLTVKPGTWTSGTTLKYQWLRNGAAISGATKPTYKLTSTDSGKTITVRVTGSKSGYETASKSAAVKWTLSTKTPTISGTLKVGSTLTAKPGTWTSGTTLKYQWYRNGTAISGATSSKYKLVAADAGKQITVKVTGSKSGYNTASKTSGKTAKIAKATLKTATPKITGTLKVGSTLTAKPGTWTSGTTFKFQWYRNGTAISGATSSTYKLKAADAGKQITVKVTGSKSGYNTASKTSGKTAKIAKATLKTATPKITGASEVGQTLGVSVGTWTSGTKFKFQWYRNGTAISGATSSSYKLKAADAGKQITVKVTGSKSGYTTASKTSSKTTKIVAVVANPVTAGAWCKKADAGKVGYTTAGTKMQCTYATGESVPRWRKV